LQSGEQALIDLGERGEEESWDISALARHSRYVGFVPIIEGCNKFCSFCIVPYSRGREVSRTPKDVIAEVIRLRDLGFKEVHLIGQNVNSYRPRELTGLEHSPGATPFCRLLRAVADTGMERIKFATSFPRDFHPDIVSAIEEYSNLCNWIHLPVQSGSDQVLKMMRRGHTAADYLRRVDAIKNSKRRMSLTSDIIVGFPGETDQDLRCTMNLVEHCEFDSLYLFKYSKRAGTPAAKLNDDVPESLKKTRFLELEAHHRKIQSRIYNSYLGTTASVLVEAESARSNEDLMGHSTCHKVVNFKGDTKQKGRIVDVLITEAKVNSLYGQQVTPMALGI
jgi:tRNA-2-methylthio-N6-dimethylallyladenosine synthase